MSGPGPDAFSSEDEAAIGALLDAHCWRCQAQAPAGPLGLCAACHGLLILDPLAEALARCRVAMEAMVPYVRALGSAVNAALSALGPLSRLLEPGPCPSCLSPLPQRGRCRRCVPRP